MLASLAMLGLARRALAQNAEIAAAEVLFREGKRLLEQRDYDQACPKLAESLRLDSATGTLLALALCHEGQGKTASAWTEYTEAAARARQEGRADRQQAATDWAAQLEPRLSTLAVVVPDAIGKTPGVLVTRDGGTVGAAAWGTAIPVDSGEHTVELLVPGKQPWKTTVKIGASADRRVVHVPSMNELLDVPKPVEPSRPTQELPYTAAPVGSVGPRPTAGHAWSTLQWAGIGTAAAGLVAAGVGAFFGLDAINKNDESLRNGCQSNECTDDGMRIRLEARKDGDRATAAFVASGVLLVGGGALFIAGAKRGAPAARVQALPVVTARGIGLSLQGSFW